MRKLLFVLILFMSVKISAQNDEGRPFMGYETMEMSMNKFKYFAGEVGFQFDIKNIVRLTIMEVKLTERHLSSKYEAGAIEGDRVEGYLRGYELYYDRFFSNHWYYSLTMGYYYNFYEHMDLGEKLENDTMTIGSGVGYRRTNLFKVEHLYLNFSIPIRYHFSKIDETQLGETTVRPHVIINNIWLFLGYSF
ncbi:hypothetical protein ACFL6E_03630 [Candidatus Neomarinimicrobiota bacterium]